MSPITGHQLLCLLTLAKSHIIHWDNKEMEEEQEKNKLELVQRTDTLKQRSEQNTYPDTPKVER